MYACMRECIYRLDLAHLRITRGTGTLQLCLDAKLLALAHPLLLLRLQRRLPLLTTTTTTTTSLRGMSAPSPAKVQGREADFALCAAQAPHCRPPAPGHLQNA